jgi:hypothetical protein
LQEFGLPYAADPAVTRHLATFLERHGAGRVDAVLFNGGAMTPASLRTRVLDQIKNGTYGICVDCGETIPMARLEAYPFADRCIRCATAAEAGRRLR